jgi:HAD superfamily hydrolase (TIGR01549 family)
MIVLFDIGSTLIDGPRYGPPRRLAQMLELSEDALPALDRILFQTPSERPSDLAAAIAERFAVDRPHAEAACAELWEAQIQEAYVVPGAAELIAALEAAGLRRAYLSNIWPPFYRFFRQSFAGEAGAPQFLSFRTGLLKPDRAFFRHALRELQAEPRDIVMVGDTYTHDMLPAIELGMRTVWLLHRPDKERASLVRVLNGEAPRPDLTLASIAELEPCTFANMNSSPKPSF